MANLKHIRNRISSVNSAMQITSAMKMVSASKLKRAQQAIEKMRPFSEKLSAIIKSEMEKLGYVVEIRNVKKELSIVTFVFRKYSLMKVYQIILLII